MIDLTTGVYIPSVDAKDIYLSAHYYNYENHDYDLKLKDGNYNLRKFVNTLDYSLDLIELLDIYYKKYRKNDFLFTVKKHKYTTNVINLTFKYSVKEWNQMNKNTFVKFGYNYRDLIFDDCIAKNNTGEIVGIQINSKVKNKLEIPSPFVVKKVEIKDKKDKSIVKEVQLQYQKKGEPKTLKTNAQLRNELYKNGFTCNGSKYCRMKRSTGSARVGKCLFINESLFKPLLNFSSGAIRLNPGDEIDLAAYEGYIALPSSSIIDTLPIKPENILLIDDYDSVFNEDVIETHDENNWLKTTEKNCTITNTIWDGQSLMDISLFGDYSEYGMVLLRNLMFKSCCFNCNIQQWFKDNNITDISQLNGKTRATKIEDVKLITTPNSIKYLKFSTWDEWLDNLYPNFGVVKHDKKTHFFEGRLVQTHYQLLNTLQMSKDEVNEFLSEALDFAQLLRNNPEVVRYYITDTVIGRHDGSYVSNTDGKHAYRVQGREYAVGSYIVASDTVMDFQSDYSKKVYIAPKGLAHSSSDATIRSKYTCIGTIPANPDGKGSDYWIGDISVDVNTGGWFPSAKGSSNSQGWADMLYAGGTSTSGTREYLMGGFLGYGLVSGSVCLHAGRSLSSAWWYFVGCD